MSKNNITFQEGGAYFFMDYFFHKLMNFKITAKKFKSKFTYDKMFQTF